MPNGNDLRDLSNRDPWGSEPAPVKRAAGGRNGWARRTLRRAVFVAILSGSAPQFSCAAERSEASDFQTFDVREFGATGDGRTNDTAAFRAAVAALGRAGSGRLLVPHGTYIVGEQSRTPGRHPPYESRGPIEVEGLDGVVVEGVDSVLKLAPGLRFGSFDKHTGLPISPALPFYDRDCAVAPGNMISISNCRNVAVRNLELDGNSDRLIPGGEWGDTGRQLPASGIALHECTNVLVENVRTRRHALDGIVVGWSGLREHDPATSCTLRNVVSEYNGRQAFSWVGGRGLVAEGCKFNRTGRGAFSSAPGAGLDIEAEDSVCREGLFVDCEFADNAGCGIVADSGDGGFSRFVRCLFVGTTAWSAWSAKPGLLYESCTFNGSVVHGFGSPNPELATRYKDCRFEDAPYLGTEVYRAAALVECSGGDNILFDGCEFVAHRTRSVWLDGLDTREIVRNCRFVHNIPLEDREFAALFRGTRIETTEFVEEYPADARIAAYIEAQHVSVGPEVRVSGPVVRWANWSDGPLGVVPSDSSPN